MNTRGPYKQYTVNGNDTIPRRTVYRKRQRLQFEVDEQIRKNIDEESIDHLQHDANGQDTDFSDSDSSVSQSQRFESEVEEPDQQDRIIVDNRNAEEESTDENYD
ncbi:Hypothetical predicted protein, partial [Paramuricea clavata]